MTNKQLSEQLKQLQDFVVKTNEQIKTAEQSVNLSIEALMNNTDDSNRKNVQNHIINIKKLMIKAKKGQNIQKEVDNIKKTLKNAR
jgi:hypothetical protein